MSDENTLAKSIETTAAVIAAVGSAAAALVELFKTLAETSDLLKDLSMPNIPFPTLGGHVFWTELANVKGWRLQRNDITRHCRILDPDDIRRAWGGEDALLKELRRLCEPGIL